MVSSDTNSIWLSFDSGDPKYVNTPDNAKESNHDLSSQDSKINRLFCLLTAFFTDYLCHPAPQTDNCDAAVLVDAGDISPCDNNDEATAKILDDFRYGVHAWRQCVSGWYNW